MFDCNSFIRRMGWKQKDLAEKLGIGTSTVGMWCIGKSTPAYEILEELIHLGMTLPEMFGEDNARMLVKNPGESDDEFDLRVKKSLLNILQKTF